MGRAGPVAGAADAFKPNHKALQIGGKGSLGPQQQQLDVGRCPRRSGAFGVVVGAHGLMASRRKRREKNPLRQRSVVVVGAAPLKRAKQLEPLSCNAGHSPEQIPSSPFCFRRSAAAAAAGDLRAGEKERIENPPSPSLTDGVPSSPAAHVRARTDGIVWINSRPSGSRGACICQHPSLQPVLLYRT